MSTKKDVAKDLGLGSLKQIGIVVKNTDKVLEFYEKTLGLGKFDSMVAENTSQRGKSKLRISLGQVGGIQFELIEVVKGETLHSDFLKQGREGLHHLGFYVADIDKRLGELEKKGIKLLERGKVLGVEYAYLDTARISGVIFELIKLG
jgi:methylmalonyl-CoA/ethylmalonyl-CoA epimerase